MKQFGSFILDPDQSRLLHKGSKVEVEIDHKVFELLSLFVQQPNTIMSRQTILDNLWAGSIVTDNAINKLIANLRKVLGDEAKKPQYIQTVPKRGYRLICKVTLLPIPVEVKTQPSGLTSSIQDKNAPVIWKKQEIKKLSSYSIISLFLVCVGLYSWQAFRDKANLDNGYTVALTRASGAEESAQMHPDNQHLYYLKNDEKKAKNILWVKNIHTSIIKQVETGEASISDIIALVEGKANTSILLYLDKSANDCGVYEAVFSLPNYVKKSHDKLFDCADKRIKDIAYNYQLNTLYYSAQPKSFWPSQVYAFDLSTKKQVLVTQVEPKGWGHHNIDVSPDGNKLLIMSTNSNYQTQVLSLNLLSNKITEGMTFNYPVTEAIWHHDSQQIYYYGPAPAQQIIRSEFNGDNAISVVNVSEVLSSKMSRLADGENILFSTEHKNINNRWLLSQSHNASIDNSTVADTYPALFHHSEQYLFISKRSGRSQLYLNTNNEKQAKIVTNFSEQHWLGYLAVSPDDKSVLINVDNKIYKLPINQLDVEHPLASLSDAQRVYTSQSPIISLDWLSASKVAVTVVNNAKPELVVMHLANRTIEQLSGDWAYGLTDSAQSQQGYLIEQQSNQLYRLNSQISENDSHVLQNKLVDTQITLPTGFYHVKIDDNTLYYLTTENNNEYLHSVPLSDDGLSDKYLINAFFSYDVSHGNLMISDVDKIEGDIHRTVFNKDIL
ncbi:MAG: winged helix-turn-helix domain-containing protein [Paraglaciecola sp.]|uniref:winged helix-turn-helix domain-containing protein n=1 Tax=Paraglaciecola sp. TaxID=1920173 RepID=UPI003297A209